MKKAVCYPADEKSFVSPKAKDRHVEFHPSTKLQGNHAPPIRKQSLFVHKFPTHGVVLRDIDHDAHNVHSNSNAKTKHTQFAPLYTQSAYESALQLDRANVIGNADCATLIDAELQLERKHMIVIIEEFVKLRQY